MLHIYKPIAKFNVPDKISCFEFKKPMVTLLVLEENN